jgi:hypothetical protein
LFATRNVENGKAQMKQINVLELVIALLIGPAMTQCSDYVRIRER